MGETRAVVHTTARYQGYPAGTSTKGRRTAVVEAPQNSASTHHWQAEDLRFAAAGRQLGASPEQHSEVGNSAGVLLCMLAVVLHPRERTPRHGAVRRGCHSERQAAN